MIGFKRSIKFKFLRMLKGVLPIWDVFLFHWTYIAFYHSYKSGLKSGSLKYSDIFIKWEWKLFLPLQCKSNDIKKTCLTRDSSSLKTSVFLEEDTICFHSFPDIFCVLCFVLLIQTIFQYLPHLQSKQKVIFTSRNYHWKNIDKCIFSKGDVFPTTKPSSAGANI